MDEQELGYVDTRTTKNSGWRDGIATGFEKFSDYDYTLRSLITNRE
jgi:hypothetical protein